MAVPVYAGQSAGDGNGGASAIITYPASIAANDLLIMHAAINNLTDTITTPSGWTLLTGPHNEPTIGRHSLYYKVAAGTETGTFTMTWTAVNKLTTRIYRFTGADPASPLSATSQSSATSATIADEGVTTPQAACLAANFVHMPKGQFAIPAFTGMTGGTWVEPVAEFQEGAGTDGNTIQIQTADMVGSGTVNGGTAAVTSNDWGAIGVSIKSVLGTTSDILLPMGTLGLGRV